MFMSTLVLPNSINGRLDSELSSIRIGSYLNGLLRKWGVSILSRLFKWQLKSLDKIAIDLTEFNEEILELEYSDAAPLLPKVSKLQRSLQRATMRMIKDKKEIIGEVPNAPAYFERLEQVMHLMDTLQENLTFIEYLTHDAKFLLTLPDDTRYKVMSFAMDRVRAEMDKDPVGKAEYEAEIKSWMDFPFDPIVEYQD
jgi:hypothetical protein